MKITYDQVVDALTIVFRPDVPVTESDEAKPGIVLDYDVEGNLVSIEILDASSHMPDVTRMEYELATDRESRRA